MNERLMYWLDFQPVGNGEFTLRLPGDAVLYDVERLDVTNARLWFTTVGGDYDHAVRFYGVAAGGEVPQGITWRRLGMVRPRGITFHIFVERKWLP